MQRSSLVRSIVVCLAWLPALAPLRSEEKTPAAPLPPIRHMAVAELPLPRDRTQFGIGEEVYFWVERPARPDTPDRDTTRQRARTPSISDADFVVWTVSDGSTALPTITRIGEKTVVTVALSDRDSEFLVDARRFDPARSVKEKPPSWHTPPALKGPPEVRPQAAKVNRLAREDLNPAFRDAIVRLSDLRRYRETSFDEVERTARAIATEFDSDLERAELYFSLTELYAQAGMTHPERVLEYSRCALLLPLDADQRTTLFIYRGDACLARHSSELFEVRRRAAAFEYLRGLAEIARHDLPDQPPERKLSVLYDTGSTGPERDKEEAEMREVREFNAHADFVTTMLQHRRILRQQILSLFVPAP